MNMDTLIDQNTLRAVEDGLVDAINLVADELTFIFFPDEYARNNNDDWTIDDRSLMRSGWNNQAESLAGSSYYTRDTRDTRETYSTKSSKKGWKRVVLKAKKGAKKSKRKSEETREGSVDSHTMSSDRREEASNTGVSIVDKDVRFSIEEDVMDLFTSETEDVESPPAIERREDASLANSAPRPDANGAEVREVIDLCDAEEAVDLLVSRNDAMASHLGESTVQRLQRLRAKREQLRQERERWENQYNGIPFDVLPQEEDEKDMRPEPQGDYDVEKDKHGDLTALTRPQEESPREIGHLQSEAKIIEFHGRRIQDKVQELSRVLDQIMIKKLNGEFPDNPETRAMEAEIRANLLEFQRWWQAPESDGEVRSAPPRPER